MRKRSYWLDLFTWKTWTEFLEAGGNISGFRESRWKSVKKIKPGDYLLCYLTGVGRFIGLLEVISSAFKDSSPIWEDDDFPSRLKVRVLLQLSPETAVPVLHLRDRLSIFENLKNPNYWSGAFRGSPYQWNDKDGEIIVEALYDAQANPIERPVDKGKLERRTRGIKSKLGTVTIPEDEEISIKEEVASISTPHEEMQYLLLKLGSEMGLDIWVARNDRNRVIKGTVLGEMPRMKNKLPIQFDDATNRIIEHIDVLWLQGNAIVAAFEIESTTSVYSGLLRLSDLIAMQPNINIPLFLVAPDERRQKVISEVNRPTFARLSPTMNELVRYISFSALQKQVREVAAYTKYLKPDFLDELSETCELEEE